MSVIFNRSKADVAMKKFTWFTRLNNFKTGAEINIRSNDIYAHGMVLMRMSITKHEEDLLVPYIVDEVLALIIGILDKFC